MFNSLTLFSVYYHIPPEPLTNTKKTMTFDSGNPDSDLGQAHMCGGINQIKGS